MDDDVPEGGECIVPSNYLYFSNDTETLCDCGVLCVLEGTVLCERMLIKLPVPAFFFSSPELLCAVAAVLLDSDWSLGRCNTECYAC